MSRNKKKAFGRSPNDRRVRRQARRAALEHGQDPSLWQHLLADPGSSSDGFRCRHCGVSVGWLGGGTDHRNHCPSCLHSVHLDTEPGDRLADCGGLMEPVSVWVRKGGEWAVIHRCKECGALSSNRIAADDNPALLLSLAARPMANPPFPLDRLG